MKEGTSKEKAPRKKKDKEEAAMHVAEEEDFPRGSQGAYIAPVERKRIRKEAEQEAFESLQTGGHLKKRAKKKGKKEDVIVDEDDFFRSLSATQKLPKFVELLKFKMIAPGMTFWGIITEVHATDLVVSLPHGLRGTVLLENVSDHFAKRDSAGGKDTRHLNQYFIVGSYVRCCVVKVSGQSSGENGKKRIDLATKVSLVNKGLRREAVCIGGSLTGCVKSVEDHGYIIDFGVHNTTGFLKKAWAPKKYLQGSILDVVVKTVNQDGNAMVSALPQEVDSCVTLEWSGVDVNSLTPGSLVNVKIRNVLSDGLLVSFLTFFTGTIDPFHLGKGLSEFHEGDKLKARILYCDHQTKSIGLSLLPHLLKKCMPVLPVRGDVFESAIVLRVDPGLGISIDLPAPEGKNEGFKAYAHISNLSDTNIDDIGSRFKSGQVVKCRVIGSRPMDGLANASLKPSVVEGSLFDVTEIKPGMKITGVVDKLDDTSMLLKISPHLMATVPAIHYSDTVHKKSHKKFKEGQTVSGRVLEVKPGKKKVIVTLKKSLVESKYPMVTSIEDVVTGMRSHGVVTGIKNNGIFVTFFNNISSMIGIDHLGIKDSQKIQDAFTVGQIVKVRVLGVRAKRLRLTLLSKQQLADLAIKNDTLGHFTIGQLVKGTVHAMITNNKEDGEVNGYVLKLESSGNSESLGRLDVTHLADHPIACSSLKETLKLGAVLENLVVLEKMDQMQQLKLTNKDSIRQAVLSGKMPKTLEDLRVGTIFPGFVASVTSDAVFVRFLDHVTARASMNQVSDSPVTDLASMFPVNMSVRACISHVDLEKQHATASLKQNMCSDIEGSYVRTLFKDLEVAHSLDDDDGIDWESAFPYGGQANVSVHQIKEYGILCDFEAYPDVVGLLAQDQVASLKNMTEGTDVSVAILDISKKDGIVDLSALDKVKEVLSDSEANTEVCIGDSVDVSVLQTKIEEGYCIVSLPAEYHPRIGYLCIRDYNGFLMNKCSKGQKIKAKVVSMPSEDTGNRLVLVPQVGKKSTSSLKALPDRGSEVEIKIDALHSLYAEITIEGTSTKGRLHISQIKQQKEHGENPLRSIELGSKHKAFIIGVSRNKGRKTPIVHVSLISANPIEWKLLQKGTENIGYVQGIQGGHIWITYSPFVKGRAFIPDLCDSLEECKDIASRYTVGSCVLTKILSVDTAKHVLDIGLQSNAPEKSWSPGTLTLGCITKVTGSGIDVKIAWDKMGHVNLTDIHSVAVKNALDSVNVGSFVQASIVSKRKGSGYNVSLRKSSGAISGIDEGSLALVEGAPAPKPSLKLSDLSTGSKVSGYVKVAGKMGVFITIGRDLDARIKLRQLNDEFVEDPLQDYPPGTYVQGKVMAINNGMIDVTLRTRKTKISVDAYSEGQIVEGKVRRIEKYGVFISLNDSSVSGLAHMSELCDGYVQNVDNLFKVGQAVRARIIKVDKEAGKLSLGLKPSYFDIGDETDDDMEQDGSEGEDLDQQLINANNSEDDESDEDMEDIDQALLAQ